MKPSFDSIAALIRELSIEEQRALVDSDNRPAIKQFLLSLQQLLTPVGTVNVRSAVEFVALDLFKVNTNKNAMVKISYIGDNFKAWFLGKTEEQKAIPGDGPYRTPDVQSEVALLRYHTLNKRSMDKPIINQLGGEAKAETTLAQIYALLEKQSNGEAGELLTNGYANIFYVRDTSSVLCAVDVNWFGGGWRVNASSVEDPGEWLAGFRVFSRDS